MLRDFFQSAVKTLHVMIRGNEFQQASDNYDRAMRIALKEGRDPEDCSSCKHWDRQVSKLGGGPRTLAR